MRMKNKESAKTQFNNYLKSIGFNDCGVLKSAPLIPSHYKTKNGNHFIPTAIHVCFFPGINTKDGDLGCVTFCYHGKSRIKYQHNTNDQAEVFKQALIPKSANQAIKAFNLWHTNAQNEIKSWQIVM